MTPPKGHSGGRYALYLGDTRITSMDDLKARSMTVRWARWMVIAITRASIQLELTLSEDIPNYVN